MPFIGLLHGDKVIPEGVDDGVQVHCPECDEKMFVWGPSSDGTARHFKHHSILDCTTARGESDIHRKLKSIAASHLKTVFSDRDGQVSVEYRLDAPVSNADYRQADSIIKFDTRDEQLGEGLIIEVQYRNDDKNISGTTVDYIAQEYAVAWAYEEDFANNQCLLDESTLRERAYDSVEKHIAKYHDQHMVDIPYPYVVPHGRSPQYYWSESEFTSNTPDRSVEIPARIPEDLFDDYALDLWDAQGWGELFTDPGHTLGSLPPEPTDDVQYNTTLPIVFPAEFYDNLVQDLWDDTPWEALFPGCGHTTKSLPPESTDDVPYNTSILVKLPREFYEDDVFLESVQEAFDHGRRFDKYAPPYKKRACRPSDHVFVDNGRGWDVCDVCNLSRQSLTDGVGQTLP